MGEYKYGGKGWGTRTERQTHKQTHQKFPQPLRHILFYDLKHHLLPFGHGDTVKAGEGKCDSLNEQVFVEQPLAPPGSANK